MMFYYMISNIIIIIHIYIYAYIYIYMHMYIMYMYIHIVMICVWSANSGSFFIVANFYPFSQFCEINISLPSL